MSSFSLCNLSLNPAPALNIFPLQDDNADAAVKGAVNVAAFLVSAATGVALGLGVAIVVVVILRVLLRRTPPGRALAARVRMPILVTLALVGATIGLQVGRSGVGEGAVLYWFSPTQHVLWIAIIFGIAAILARGVHVIEDFAEYRYGDSEAGRARRVTTQTQVLRRVLQAVIVVIAIIVAALTFPSMRTAMTALLSSAGVVSLVAGIAAQNVLGNMFAGLQIAFTDSVRVGDILYYEDQYGTVEEITLTYMVLRLWDEKRLIVPSKKLTEDSIQNWTRRHTQVLGVVELPVDWRVPVNAARQEMHRLLKRTDLWDGETASIQITDTHESHLIMRVCVSAEDPSKLWDLRCYLRENLVTWVVRNAPYALVRYRLEQNPDRISDAIKAVTGNRPNMIAPQGKDRESATEQGVMPSFAGSNDQTVVMSADEAREEVEKLHQQRACDRQQAKGVAALVADQSRQGVFDRFWAAAHPGTEEGLLKGLTDEDRTMLLNVREILAQAGFDGSDLPDLDAENGIATEDTASSRLYSGSPQAEQRAQAFQGPGEEVFAERERHAEEVSQSEGGKVSPDADDTDNTDDTDDTVKVEHFDDYGEPDLTHGKGE